MNPKTSMRARSSGGFRRGPPGERFAVIDTGEPVTRDLQEVPEGKTSGGDGLHPSRRHEGALKRIDAQNGRMVLSRQKIPALRVVGPFR